MEQLLIAREAVVKFFKRYEVFIMPFLKFALGMYVFSSLTSVGHVHEALSPVAEKMTPFLLNILFSLLFTIMPMNMSWLLIILTATVQFSDNLQVAMAVFIFLLLIFLFYARMATKESVLIIFTLIAFKWNIPYIVPIIAGLYFPVTSVIPITIGVFIHAQVKGLFRLTGTAAATTVAAPDRELSEVLTGLPDVVSEVYTNIMGNFSSPSEWLFTAIIFVMVIVLVYFISRMSIDFAKEIAIGLSCVMMIFGFIIAVLTESSTVNIGTMILGTVVCGFLAYVVRFFDGILDYQRAESVQFEDEKNYYHVRIVPKVIMTKSQRSVKRIRPQLPENPLEEPEDEE